MRQKLGEEDPGAVSGSCVNLSRMGQFGTFPTENYLYCPEIATVQ